MTDWADDMAIAIWPRLRRVSTSDADAVEMIAALLRLAHHQGIGEGLKQADAAMTEVFAKKV